MSNPFYKEEKRMKKSCFGFTLGILMSIIAFLGMLTLSEASPIPGGKLRVGLTGRIVQLDPMKQRAGEEYIVNFLIFNALTVLDHKLTPQPELAESWSHSDDLMTWTFRLRKGVLFHHGREMTADDVVFSLKRILDPAIGSPTRANLAVIDTVEKVDAYTVRLKLKNPYAELAHVLAERHAKILPADKEETISKEPIGTGPFKMKDYVPGDHVLLEKNPRYWEKGLPYLSEVVVRMLPEPAVAVTALETGELDVLWLVPLENIEKLKTNPKLRIISAPTSSWDVVAMRGDMPPFNDPKVVLALKYGVNKEELVKTVLFGYGTASNGPISPSNPIYNSAHPIRKQDVAMAKKLLTEAGHGKGLNVRMYVPEGRPTRVRLGVALQAMLKPVGFNIEIQRVPWDKFLADIEGKEIFYVDGFFGRSTADTALYPWFHSAGSWNIWKWKNSKADELLDKGRKTASFDERKRVYGELQKLIEEECPAMIPYVLNHHDGHQAYVKDLQSHPLMWLDLKKVWMEKR